MAEEIAAAAGVGEEPVRGNPVGVPPNWGILLAPGGAQHAATGSRVLGDHRSELAARRCFWPKRRASPAEAGARVSAKREEGGAGEAYKGRREVPASRWWQVRR